ncbi:Sterol 24-C-methyltransferase [Hondaea fermentalgiana]|uniref:Methyltransferase n=1 Tax=Hondaea fermentalgiana TaxID=2315210 RepID=A0A2R5G8G7_9STRA|nr:Sterol 24-C-methyltransferase [Hondaea fermentalgiana]|eukprot:GBG27352.1 Sterol 24-C-methyltransferase [Hondaea fermentalgiana]
MVVLWEKGENHSSDQFVGAINHAMKNTVDNEDKDKNYAPVVKSFYASVATSLYEYGWGKSFHFAPRNKGEGFKESLLRQEHWLAAQLGIRPGQDVCDLGCGVCGPLVNIAKFSRANITGVTISDFQIARGNAWIAQNGLSNRCKAVEGDFHELPFEDNSFDCGYDCEATAHSTKLNTFFAEVERVLRPGGVFAGFAWVTLPKHNPEDPEEVKILEDLAFGNAIAVLHSFDDYVNAIKANPGLELVEAYDANKLGDDMEWHEPLKPGFSIDGILMSWAGRQLTANLARVTEAIGLAPKGTYNASQVLEVAARSLVDAGDRGIYTPIYYYKVRKVAKN